MNFKLSQTQLSPISLFFTGILTGLTTGYLICKYKRKSCCTENKPLQQSETETQTVVTPQPDVQL